MSFVDAAFTPQHRCAVADDGVASRVSRGLVIGGALELPIVPGCGALTGAPCPVRDYWRPVSFRNTFD